MILWYLLFPFNFSSSIFLLSSSFFPCYILIPIISICQFSSFSIFSLLHLYFPLSTTLSLYCSSPPLLHCTPYLSPFLPFSTTSYSSSPFIFTFFFTPHLSLPLLFYFPSLLIFFLLLIYHLYLHLLSLHRFLPY